MTTHSKPAASSTTAAAATAATATQTNTFRTKFDYTKGIFWYPSHQTKALKQLKNGIHHIDVVVEVRDARIPITSINRQFDEFLANRARIVVYNKADLATHNTRIPLCAALERFRNEKPIFTCADRGLHAKQVLEAAISICRMNPERYPYLSMIVVGIPNVGKSSLINSLRHLGVKKGKVTAVGKIAGVTTAIQTRVKIYEDPPIYLVDTPGIFDPHVSSPMEGLKIALTGGTRDRLTEELHVADYLLFRMNQSALKSKYPQILGLPGPTDDIHTVLRHICRQKHFVLNTRGRIYNLSMPRSSPPGSTPSTSFQSSSLKSEAGPLDSKTVADTFLAIDQAARYLIEMYRDGKLGQITLDDCSPDALHAALSPETLPENGLNHI